MVVRKWLPTVAIVLLVALYALTGVDSTTTQAAEEAAVEEGFVSIFNGKDFTGWEGDQTVFRIEDGAIVGGSLKKPLDRNEFFCTKKQYANFELRFEAKVIGQEGSGKAWDGANAGVQFRSLRIPNHNEVSGYQADMAVETNRNVWGSLYDEARRNEMLALGDQDVIKEVFKPREWNDFTIRAEGKRIQLWVNGRQTVDYTETEPGIPITGIIGLQIHGGPPSEAWYRNLRIKELPNSDEAEKEFDPHAAGSSVERARDPWVFRLNLDDRPRMIVLALNEQMWAAYDAQRGALYRLWRDGVHFTGPLFDNINAAQPLSIGEAYMLDTSTDSPWRLMRGDQEEVVKAEYLGYVLKNNVATLRYALPLAGGQQIIIEETPEFVAHESGKVGLNRWFTTSGVPEGVQVVLNASFEHASFRPRPYATSAFAATDFSRNRFDWGSSFKAQGMLVLSSNALTRFTAYFDPRALGDKPEAGDGKSSLAGSGSGRVSLEGLDILARGKVLIGQHDCASCHTMTQPMIGPPFIEVAKKYDNSDETINKLVLKVRTGGKGVWGERPMLPHLLEPEDAKAIISYVLSLDSGEMAKPQPGIAVDYYDMGAPLARLPKIAAGQYPNISMVYPVLNNRSGNPDRGRDTDENFEGYDTDFVIHAKGYLNIKEKKEYDLRLIANNGGRMVLDGEEIFNGYRYEGTYRGSKKIMLDVGAHPFKIEYYHHLFAKALVLQWRSEGERRYRVIPAEMFTHDPYDIKPTSRGFKQMVKTTAPGFGAVLDESHPSYDLSRVRPRGFEPRVGGLDVTPEGRLVISTWDGDVYILDNVTGDSDSRATVKKIASGLYEPLGLTVVDGEIYVFQRWELTHLVDTDGDEIIDEYRVVADDWGATADYHEWSYGLIYRDGHFYATLGIAQGKFARTQPSDRGKTIKIATDGSYTFLNHGLRAPNGIGFATDGEIFITDNEGEWLPANKFMHVREDHYDFFSSRAVLKEAQPDLKTTPPTLWLPLTEIANSPTQPIILHGGPYEGQTLIGDITRGGLTRIFLEKIDGVYQGVVFRFAQGLEVGIERMDWGPDGALYIGGLGGDSDFNHNDSRFGLQRMKYNGKTTFEMLAVRAKANGLEIEFTEPLRIGDGTAPSDYLVQQWWYNPTSGYGGSKLDVENLTIRSVSFSEDRTKVFLETEGMKPEHVLYVNIQTPTLSETNQQLWSNEAWVTLNAIPSGAGVVNPATYAHGNNELTDAELSAGWTLLFDGKTTNGWRGFKQQSLPDGWAVHNGELTASGAGSVLLTDQEFDNFELEMEWKIEDGGESGILYHVVELEEAAKASHTGLEFQIIDDVNHPDAKTVKMHLSGASYDLFEPRYTVARPAGEYNHARIVMKGGNVEHWVNGIKVIENQVGSNEWNAAFIKSLFAEHAHYGRAGKGHVALQNNEAGVSFRNIRIRPLP